MLLGNATNYLIRYPGLQHDPLEELIFERVALKEPSVEIKALQARLVKDHASLAAKASDLLASIGLQQLQPAEGMHELRQAGSEFIMAYDAHFRFEERDIFPVAEDYLHAGHWAEISAKLALSEDPLFNPRSLALYGNLYDALMSASTKLDG